MTAYNIPPHVCRAVAERESYELRRRLQGYDGDHPFPSLHTIHAASTRLADVEDIRAVMDFIGDAELALLGEASHGTHEFYAHRANITKHLIIESGFRRCVR